MLLPPGGLELHEARLAASVSALVHARHPSADARQYMGLLLTYMPCLQQSLLFRHCLQDLPSLGDPWDKGLTPFRLQRGFAQGIVVRHRHEGLGDLPGQRPVGVTMGGKATMTVARAGPKDAHALRRHNAGLVHSCQGGTGHRSRVILARHDAVHHIALAVSVGGLAFLAKRREGQILTGVDPHLLQEMVGQQPRLYRPASAEREAFAFTCLPLIVPACTWGPLYTPTRIPPNISSTVYLGHTQTNHS